LQAVGRDARGRRQYRYHPEYRRVRDETKFGRMVAFAAVLPDIRRRVQQDLSQRPLSKTKVLAAVVRLLETTFVRVGNEEYVRENTSFGLTTLRNHHVEIDGARLQFRFRGKSGQMHQIALTDRRLAAIVRQCRELPGYDLFEYLDENQEVCKIVSEDVNGYLRETTGQDFTAKDFRTWAGTVLAAQELVKCGECRSMTHIRKRIVGVVKTVASRLGNRPATCRKYYVHPAILESYSSGLLIPAMQHDLDTSTTGLSKEELCVLALIRSSIVPQRERRAS
jgi:DNA topoisomerase-1